MNTITNSGDSRWSKWIKYLFGSAKNSRAQASENMNINQSHSLKTFENEVREVLKKVIDPELEINIVDLGLIYKIEEKDNNRIFVEMTLSTPACPIGDVIIQNVMDTLERAYPAKQADVTLVFEPAWHPGLLSDHGRKALEGKL